MVPVAPAPVSEILRERGTLVLPDLNEINLIAGDNAIDEVG